MEKPITGRCLCGAVAYECRAAQVTGDHCHCLDCRKTSGTGHMSHLGVPAASVTVTGRTTAYDTVADSGNIVSRHFCPVCGSPVYAVSSGMKELLFLRASTLDDIEAFRPEFVVYTRSRPSWDHVGAGLPEFEAMPSPAETKRLHKHT